MWIFLSKKARAGIFYVSAGGNRFGFLALSNIVICYTNETFFFCKMIELLVSVKPSVSRYLPPSMMDFLTNL